MKTALLQAAPRASQASSIVSKILSMVPTKASLPCVMTHARLDKATSVVQDSKAMIPSISFTLRTWNSRQESLTARQRKSLSIRIAVLTVAIRIRWLSSRWLTHETWCETCVQQGTWSSCQAMAMRAQEKTWLWALIWRLTVLMHMTQAATSYFLTMAAI